MSERTDTGVRLYNTLTKQKDPLTVGPDGTVRIYACGPTVYAPIHIGNARPFVVFSVLKRFLERHGQRAVLVCNLTDVNDKIYDAARREGVPSTEWAERMCARYVADTDGLGLGRPDHEPKVTETVPEIIALIQRLIERGYAYPAGGDVYYRVGRFPAYGALSGQRVDEMEPAEGGVGKESPLDFALWKGRKEGEDAWWDSPWGPGRPGWHIECSAMAEVTLGRSFEIHGGGLDLIFPHHENEIAQTEGANGEPLAQIWMHNGMLELGGDKMSKSLGNIAPLADVLAAWPREVVVAFFLTSHYRSRLPFNDERLGEARVVCERIANGLRELRRAIAAPGEGADADLARAVADARREAFAALADDFNTPRAMAAIHGLVSATNTAVARSPRPGREQLAEAHRQLVELLDMLGLGSLDADEPSAPPEVLELARRRERARAARDFAASDALRDEIAALGWVVRDSADGQQVFPA